MRDRWQFNPPDHGDELCGECGGCAKKGCKAHERCEHNAQHNIGGDK